MRSVIFSACLMLLLSSCFSSKHSMKVNYDVVPDAKTKVLRGVINRSIIESDTSFAWFKDNMKYGTSDTATVRLFREKKDKFTMLVFGGTWCSDTQNLWPVFYRLVDKSGYPENSITLIAVDRKKTTIKNLQVKYKITNVPTFIVIQDGKEVGRVTEYGKSGMMDKELGDIVKTIQ